MSINPGRDLENERRGMAGKGWGRLNRASQEPEFLQMKLAAAAARQKEPGEKSGAGSSGGGAKKGWGAMKAGVKGSGAAGGANGLAAFGGGGGGGFDFAAVVKAAVKVNKTMKMLIDTCHAMAPNGRYDFAMANAATSPIGYKKLSDSCTAAEFADGEGEGCVVLVIICANRVGGSPDWKFSRRLPLSLLASSIQLPREI